jgi:Asp-tRNA(Asn)/Glu-tRNA(Gln) amidotransferase A subunit family amidase
MPLNTFKDAVGPIAKSVRELALVLDHVTGPDPEDEATRDAAAHIAGSFAAGLDAATLRGARIGVLRQLFVGVTGEREVAALMETVVRELRAGGATVVDVSIPDLDAEYRAARGSAPGSLKAGWTAYLSRGAPGDPCSTSRPARVWRLFYHQARRRAGVQPPAGGGLRTTSLRFTRTAVSRAPSRR